MRSALSIQAYKALPCSCLHRLGLDYKAGVAFFGLDRATSMPPYTQKLRELFRDDVRLWCLIRSSRDEVLGDDLGIAAEWM
jgi:hypothetical protein